MSSNILEIPFRRTQSVNLSTAIKSYIESKFDQQPAAFEDDCREIERLREDAVHITEPHVSGIQKLTTYVAQLRYMVSSLCHVQSVKLTCNRAANSLSNWASILLGGQR